MAELVVSIAIEKLTDLLIEKEKLPCGVEAQCLKLRDELRRIQFFLRDADVKQHEDVIIKNLVAEIREVSCDVEDVLAVFRFKVERLRRRRGTRNILTRTASIFKQAIALYTFWSEIETINSKINGIFESFIKCEIIATTDREGSSSACTGRFHDELTRTKSHIVDEDCVGRQDEIEELVSVLVNEDHRVVSICGMGGLGKTTLASMVYHHAEVRRHFDSFAWVCISQQWQQRHLLQGILTNIIPTQRDQIMKMMDAELMKRLFQALLEKKYLVVLDDIWSIEAWDSLRNAFPTNNQGSKILLTTRLYEVARHADPNGFCCVPSFINEEESWRLLLKKAFPRWDSADSMDKNMEILAREMLFRCLGLPKAIDLLGGLLASKPTLREWEKLHDDIVTKGHEPLLTILASSYQDLPYQLRPCFLYLSQFSEIETEKLYQLWSAEGIIPSSTKEEETMIDVAESYLYELQQRGMVHVELEDDSSRLLQTCRVHYLVQDRCLSIAEEENFLKLVYIRSRDELVDSSRSSSSCTNSYKLRRVAIYFDKYSALSQPLEQEIDIQHVRSILFFGGEFCSFDKIKFSLANSKLLKVLDLEGSLYPNFATMGELINLRYLNLRNCVIMELPSSIFNLRYLETLDLRFRSRILSAIPSTFTISKWNFGKLVGLKHLYLPHFNDIKTSGQLQLDGLSNLETLVNFNSRFCAVVDLEKLTNLRKLDAELYPCNREEFTRMVNYLSSTSNRLRHSSICIDHHNSSVEDPTLLRQLFECQHLNRLSIWGSIPNLPENHWYFCPNLTKLNLYHSKLDQDPMPVLETLPKLKSLYMAYETFTGKKMVCSPFGFLQLKYLWLSNLLLLEEWRVDEGAMPNLSVLNIKGCHNLMMLPSGLRFITTLGKLEIGSMPEAFKNRIRVVDGEEGEDFYKVRHVSTIII